MPHREPFDPKRPLVAARDFTFAGVRYGPGDPFPSPEAAPVASFPRRLIERQYNTMAVNHAAEATDEASDPIQMTGPKGGRYEISAPWLDEPEKVQGREAAEARQRELHEAGEPESHHGVTLTEADTGNGYYDVKADWLAEAERVHGQDAARERAAELREAGPPEGWTPESGIAATPEGEQASDDQGNAAGSDDGAQADETAQSDGETADPASAGADENPSNAESEGAADEATDDAAATDGAEQAEGEGEEQPADAVTDEAPVEETKPTPRKRSRTAKAAKAEAGASKDDSPADA